MKAIPFLKILAVISFFGINSFADINKNDTLIINVTKIIKTKIEKAKWLKNSVARADLFNIPVMVAVYEGSEVDVSKTDGEDPTIFSRVIANSLINDALNNSFNKFETFIIDTLFDQNVEENTTDLYVLRSYVSHVDNKRKPVFIVSSEILLKKTFEFVGKEFQDSLITVMRLDREKEKVSPEKNEKKKKSWFKRKKKKKVKVKDQVNDSVVITTDSIKDTVTEVFLGTDSLENYEDESGSNKAFLIFGSIIVVLFLCFALFWFWEKKK